MTEPFPLPQRMAAAIASLRENYSKAAAKTAADLLAEALPFAAGERIPPSLARSMDDILEGCADLVRRPPLIDDKFKTAWAYTREHLLNETACGEPEGQEALDVVDGVMAKLTAEAPMVAGVDHALPGRRDETVAMVIVDGKTLHWRKGDRCRIRGEGSEVFTLAELGETAAMPVSAAGTPNGWKSYDQLVPLPADHVVDIYEPGIGWKPAVVTEQLHSRLKLYHAQAVAETLWHTLRKIAEIEHDMLEHDDEAALASYTAKVRELAKRRTMLIGDLPADESVSDGAWVASEAETLRGDLEALEAWRKGAKALLASGLLRSSKPAAIACADPAVFWAEVREGLSARLLPPALMTRAGAVADALERGNADNARMPIDEEVEVYADETVAETAAALLREIAAMPTTWEGSLAQARSMLDGYERWSKALADYIVEHHKPGQVDPAAVAILDGYHVGETEVAGAGQGEPGESTLEAAVRLLRLAYARGVFATGWPAADEASLRRKYHPGLIAHWLNKAARVYDKPLTKPEDIHAIVRLAFSDPQPETIDVRFVEVHYAIGPNNEAQTVVRFVDLPDFVMPDADADEMQRQLMKSHPAGWAAAVAKPGACTGDVEPARAAVETQFVELFYLSEGRTGLRFKGLPDLYLPDENAVDLQHQLITRGAIQPPAALVEGRFEPKSGELPMLARPGRLFLALLPPTDKLAQEVRFAVYYLLGNEVWLVDQGHVHLLTLLAARKQVLVEVHLQPTPATSWEAAPEKPAALPSKFASGPTELRERADMMATNLATLAASLGVKDDATEQARAGLVTAAALFSEISEALKPSGSYWLVDEYNDTEGESFGIVIPSSPEVDAALLRWAKTYDKQVAPEAGREPHEHPINLALGSPGALTFTPNLTYDDIEKVEGSGENGYSVRVRLLTPDGIQALLKTIAELPEGASLSLYKGMLSTCYANEEPAPVELFDLWTLCDTDIWDEDGDDAEDDDDELGEHHHADDMALGDD